MAFIVLAFLASGAMAEGLDDELRTAAAETKLYETKISHEVRLARLNAFLRQCTGLLEKHPSPEEKGQIYRRMVQTIANTGMLAPGKAIEYSQKALELTSDPLEKLEIYSHWGDACRFLRGVAKGNDLAQARRAAMAPYLQGLALIEASQVSEEKPKIPKSSFLTYDGPKDTEDYRRLIKEQEDERKAVELALFQSKMIDYRTRLTGQIVYLYSRFPFATDELKSLATEALGNPMIVNKLIDKVRTQIAERVEGEYPLDKKLNDRVASINEFEAEKHPVEKPGSKVEDKPTQDIPIIPVSHQINSRKYWPWVAIATIALASLAVLLASRIRRHKSAD